MTAWTGYDEPTVGDRVYDDKPLEWTGDAWTPVCPRCDRPMADRDAAGRLRCGQCGLKSVDR